MAGSSSTVLARDQSTPIKIARLRTLAARKGKPLDAMRFVGDRQFAHQVLTDLMDTDDEDVPTDG